MRCCATRSAGAVAMPVASLANVQQQLFACVADAAEAPTDDAASTEAVAPSSARGGDGDEVSSMVAAALGLKPQTMNRG